jgi:8-oxo-dGTP pyrophosphatase MutT (NUDIX family)
MAYVPYVKTAGAAKVIGVGASSLRMWAARGYLTPAARTPGGHALWDIADLRRQLSQKGGPLGSPDSPIKIPVVSAVVTSSRGLLLSRRNDRDPQWALIGGKVHEGESPADAAVREVKEETGLLVQVGPGGLIGERIHPKNGRHMIYIHAVPTHGLDVFVGDKDELAEVRWVPLSEADRLVNPYPFYGPVHDFLERVLNDIL